ncbi:MAG TPA: hypothetical protein VN784_09215 [Candidatus Limnocylindrales bacterium]|nr:hypothetical protein [Candidatus Limnocylindrales bacterium]
MKWTAKKGHLQRQREEKQRQFEKKQWAKSAAFDAKRGFTCALLQFNVPSNFDKEEADSMRDRVAEVVGAELLKMRIGRCDGGGVFNGYCTLYLDLKTSELPGALKAVRRAIDESGLVEGAKISWKDNEDMVYREFCS